MNFCDLNLIYNDDFSFSLGRENLESYFSGVAFDNKTSYSRYERERLETDINTIGNRILSSKPVKESIAVMTAGAPGAGKTTLMEQHLKLCRENGANFAYICPDSVCLKEMEKTYKAEIARRGSSDRGRLEAYNKWRPGSNAAAHVILANLIRENFAFYFGTTSTSPFSWKLYEFLKSKGYTIHVIHVTAPDDVRWESIKMRDKEFIQTTEKDVRDKGVMLPERINDTYLKYADMISFYYRKRVDEDAALTGIWTRNPNDSEKTGSLKIYDADYYERIKSIHNEAIKTSKNPDLTWENTVEAVSSIRSLNG